jgi:cell division protein FtsW
MTGTERGRARKGPRPGRRPDGGSSRPKPPLEYSMLYTATLCLLAGGAVMVYSASSAESLLGGSGDPAYYLKRYLLFGLVGLGVLHLLSRRGLGAVRAATPALLAVAFALTVLVMLPGAGVTVNGATRWLAAGPIQFQPAELLKLSLVLYAARLLAARPSAVTTLRGVVRPLLLVIGVAALVLLQQPDMGTTIVICLAVGALLVAAGVSTRHLLTVAGALVLLALVVALAEPYRRARLTAFLDPWSDSGDTGFQAVQAMIAIGSGGMFGVGLGESVQKIFYLPEAHTDMILAIIGEELGMIGISAVVALYGMIAYAGFRAAKLARDRYSKLLAAGITSLILCQATLNLFAVMGLAPLTGVPLPLISYGSTNLIVVLAGMGLLLNVAATGRSAPAGRRPLRAVQGGREGRAASGDRGRGDRGARRARAGDRRRAAG